MNVKINVQKELLASSRSHCLYFNEITHMMEESVFFSSVREGGQKLVDDRFEINPPEHPASKQSRPISCVNLFKLIR